MTLATDGPALAALRAESAARQAELTRLRGELIAFNQHDLEVARLQREVDLCAVSYRKCAESLEQARIDEDMENQRISNISVVQPASYEALPVRPKAAMNLLLGLAAAISGAVGVAYWADGRRRSGVPQPVAIPAAGIGRPSDGGGRPSAGGDEVPSESRGTLGQGRTTCTRRSSQRRGCDCGGGPGQRPGFAGCTGPGGSAEILRRERDRSDRTGDALAMVKFVPRDLETREELYDRLAAALKRRLRLDRRCRLAR